ncbi:conserved hypothetical protein [Rubrivivax sp. A210]|uniref:PilN domain-containing protein n=1 Tax=Rubrivivax sp. A210 TaxID=2772301 RepID=UPI001919E01A|nr:PilN domain-containing protein [Rubrivivax sp. A210]CAD5373347.1 conserved hypothetical protein [Rubrivivax sp. A210]
MHLAPIAFIESRRWPLAGVLLALLAAVLLAWQAQRALDEGQALQRQRAAPRRVTAATPAVPPAQAQRQGQIETLARQLATPWERLFELFERQTPPGIVLTRLDADAQTGRLEIKGQARGAEALGRYLVLLERDPRLAGVLLRRHERPRDEAGAALEFAVGATWRAAAAAEITP